MGGSERRLDTRIKTAFEVVNAIPPLEGMAYLSDVSSDGAHLEGTPAQPALGESIHLAVRLAKGEPPLLLIGEVVRHTAQGFAVRFEKPCAELAQLVRHEPELAVVAGAARTGTTAIREVAVDACANTQWMAGRICTPPVRTLLDHLNQDDPFVRIVDAVVPHQPDPLPFLTARTDALDLVVPADGQQGIEHAPGVGNFVTREIKVLLPYAVIAGTAHVLSNIRVSDHLMRCGAFLALRDCRVGLARGQRPTRDLSRVQVLLVNTRRVVGVTDLAESRPSEPGSRRR